VDRKRVLAIVADSMGGHAAGEVASRIACETALRVYYESQSDTQSALREAFLEANREIYVPAQNDDALRGMGTTCTALVLRNDSAICAHEW
jgi:protein phosphatase